MLTPYVPVEVIEELERRDEVEYLLDVTLLVRDRVLLQVQRSQVRQTRLQTGWVRVGSFVVKYEQKRQRHARDEARGQEVDEMVVPGHIVPRWGSKSSQGVPTQGVPVGQNIQEVVVARET